MTTTTDPIDLDALGGLFNPEDHANGHAGLVWGPEPTPRPAKPVMPAYPIADLPPLLADPLTAACRLSRASYNTGGIAFLTALSLLAQDDYTTIDLSGQVKPLSIFGFAIADSGFHKSTIAKAAFAAHIAADTTLARKWQDGSARYKASLAKQEPDPQPPQPTPRCPKRNIGDATAEALLSGYTDSFRNACLYNPEAGTALLNWSNRKGSQAGRSMFIYNSHWDGDPISDIRVNRADANPGESSTLALLWMVQESVGLPWILSPETGNGFIARTLVAMDLERPSGPESQDPADDTERAQLQADLTRWTNLLASVRERQDRGRWIHAVHREVGGKYQWEYGRAVRPWSKGVIALEPAARQFLADCNNAWEVDSDQARAAGDTHLASVYIRAAEQSIRLAALFAALDAYAVNADPATCPAAPTATYDHAAAAVCLVEFHIKALQTIAELAGYAETTAQLRDAIEVVRECYAQQNGWGAEYISPAGLRLNTLLNNRGEKAAIALRKDTQQRLAVIALMAEECWIQAVGRGRWMVHPCLLPAA